MFVGNTYAGEGTANSVGRLAEPPAVHPVATLLASLASRIHVSSIRHNKSKTSSNFTAMVATEYPGGEKGVEVKIKLSMQAALASGDEMQSILEYSGISALFGYALSRSHFVLVAASLWNQAGTRVGAIEAHFKAHTIPL